MVIDDLHFMRPILSPAETNSPLIVDPDAVLALPAALQGLQTIARWHPKFFQLCRRIE
jgi:hypothetical protein